MTRLQNILRAVLCLALTCGVLGSAFAGTDFEMARARAAAANPPGVLLTLSVAGGRTQFHHGEVVPLSAVFTSDRPNAYRLNTDLGSRDLDWGGDSFAVDTPTGATDPLPALYSRGFGGAYTGPGPRFQPLAAAPLAVPYTLNEWLRFDKPGRYRVFLTTHRIVEAGRNGPGGLFFVGLPAVSNAVTLDILPDDPAWDAQTLQAALPPFNAEGQDYKTLLAQEPAARTLRFLGTPEAVWAMVARYGSYSESDFLNSHAYFQTRLGLLGYTPLPQVIREMERRLADPSFPVSNQLVVDLAEAQFLAAYPQAVPAYVPNDPAQEKAQQAQLQQRWQARASMQDQARALLEAAIPAKQGRAQALSRYALVQLNFRHQDTAAYRDSVRGLVTVFADLTPEQQEALLDDSWWKDVRGPAMLPILRRVYAEPATAAEPGTWKAVDAVNRRSAALRRLTELSPAEGRARLLAEIKSRSPQVDLATLCSLPDKTLPALDSVLAANLEGCLSNGPEDWQITPRLVECYATAAILPRVKAAYRDSTGKWACAIQSDLLAYFLRTDPAYGLIQMKKALGSRKDTGCYRSALSDAGALFYSPEVERLAALCLNDPDPAVAADAAKTLGAYGSPAAEAPLWKRMQAWHGTWAGKADQIEPAGSHSAWTQGEVEYALVGSLAAAPGWVTDAAQLRTLDSLCVTRGAHQIVAGFLQDWAEEVPIRCTSGDTWQVVQYHSLPSAAALETKLAQFPQGTRFQLSPFGFSDRAAQEKSFHSLQSFLQAHGMSLKREPWPPR